MLRYGTTYIKSYALIFFEVEILFSWLRIQIYQWCFQLQTAIVNSIPLKLPRK